MSSQLHLSKYMYKSNLRIDQTLDTLNLPLKWMSDTDLIDRFLLNDQVILSLIV